MAKQSYDAEVRILQILLRQIRQGRQARSGRVGPEAEQDAPGGDGDVLGLVDGPGRHAVNRAG